MSENHVVKLAIRPRTAELLMRLLNAPAMSGRFMLEDVVWQLVLSAAEGVRRPGSWEREWVEQAFGEVPEP